MKVKLIILLYFSCHLVSAQEENDFQKLFFFKKKDTSVFVKHELSLIFVGDIMGHLSQIKSAYHKRTRTYQYDTIFSYMKPIFKSVDFTIANLEVTLGTKPYSGYPSFSSPKELVIAAKKAGINVLVTANNHSYDKGKKGFKKTLKILDSLQILHTGTFYNPQQKNSVTPLIIEKNGIKIAVINFTYGTNGVKVVHPNIVNYLDTLTIQKSISKAKLKHPDKIIAFVHWGKEYKDAPSKNQQKLNAFFNKNGVDIVVGSHPHVVQPILFSENEGVQTRKLVAYSLGNFVSHQRAFRKDGGVVLQLTFAKKNKKTIIKNSAYILTWVYVPKIKKKKYYLVLPASKFENNPTFFEDEKAFLKMKKFITHARNLLNKDINAVLEKKIN